jgi:tryptophan synthase alpha chain
MPIVIEPVDLPKDSLAMPISSPQAALTTQRIQQAFAKANSEGRAAFIGYIPAGFPSHASSIETGKLLLAQADILEVGLPYSDPLGDGPTLQRANEKALAGGITVAGTFEVVRQLRTISNKPIMVMTYYNPILATGEENFVRQALAAGVDGLILPDLPPDEADTLIPIAKAAGLALTFLVAPTSTAERIRLVAAASTGFIYAVSVTGVTGARTGLPVEVPAMLALVKSITDTPVAVGFGVGSRETAHFVAQVADGVVAASVFINAQERGLALEPFITEIVAGCQR